MGAIAGFALDVEAEPLGRQIGEDALVRQFQNVDRLLIEDAGDMEQRAGPILQDDTQAGETSRTGEIAQQHIGEQAGVDIAAGQDQADIATGKLLAIAEQCGETGRAGPLHHRLLDLEQQAHRFLEAALAHQHDVVD